MQGYLVPATVGGRDIYRVKKGKEESLGPTCSPICMTGPDCSTQWHTGLDLGAPGRANCAHPLDGITLASWLVFPLRPLREQVSSCRFNSHTPHPKMPEFPP